MEENVDWESVPIKLEAEVIINEDGYEEYPSADDQESSDQFSSTNVAEGNLHAQGECDSSSGNNFPLANESISTPNLNGHGVMQKIKVEYTEDRGSVSAVQCQERNEQSPSTSVVEGDSHVHKEGDTSSKNHVPLASESTSAPNRNGLGLMQRIKVEYNENKEHVSAGHVQESSSEAGSTNVLEKNDSSSGNLPATSESNSSTNHNVPGLMRRIKVEYIENEESSITGNHQESFSQTSNTNMLEDVGSSSGNNLPCTSSSDLSTNQDVQGTMQRIKVEYTEDESSSSTEPFRSFAWHVPTLIAPSSNLEVNSAPSPIIKTEDSSMQGPSQNELHAALSPATLEKPAATICVDAPINHDLNNSNRPTSSEVIKQKEPEEMAVSAEESDSVPEVIKSDVGAMTDGKSDQRSLRSIRYKSSKSEECYSSQDGEFMFYEPQKKRQRKTSEEKRVENQLNSSRIAEQFEKKFIARYRAGYGFPCPICRKRFKEYSTISSHVLKHSDKVRALTNSKKFYACIKCGNLYEDKGMFIRHVLSFCKGKVFVCELCLTKCKSAFELKAHIRSHFIKEPFLCEKCSRYLKSNAWVKKSRPIICKQCHYNWREATDKEECASNLEEVVSNSDESSCDHEESSLDHEENSRRDEGIILDQEESDRKENSRDDEESLRYHEESLCDHDGNLHDHEKSLRNCKEHLRDPKERLRDCEEILCDQSESLRNCEEILRNHRENLRDCEEILLDRKESLRNGEKIAINSENNSLLTNESISNLEETATTMVHLSSVSKVVQREFSDNSRTIKTSAYSESDQCSLRSKRFKPSKPVECYTPQSEELSLCYERQKEKVVELTEDKQFAAQFLVGDEFGCTLCRLKFKKFSNLTQHILCHGNHVKRNFSTYLCRKCGGKYTDAKAFVIHVLLPCPGKLFCQLCQAIFKNVSSLKVHVRSHFNKELSLCKKCSECLLMNCPMEKWEPILCQDCQLKLKEASSAQSFLRDLEESLQDPDESSCDCEGRLHDDNESSLGDKKSLSDHEESSNDSKTRTQYQEKGSRDHEESLSDHGESLHDHGESLSDHGESLRDNEESSCDHEDSLFDHGESSQDHEENLSSSQHGESLRDNKESSQDHEESSHDNELMQRIKVEVPEEEEGSSFAEPYFGIAWHGPTVKAPSSASEKISVTPLRRIQVVAHGHSAKDPVCSNKQHSSPLPANLKKSTDKKTASTRQDALMDTNLTDNNLTHKPKLLIRVVKRKDLKETVTAMGHSSSVPEVTPLESSNSSRTIETAAESKSDQRSLRSKRFKPTHLVKCYTYQDESLSQIYVSKKKKRAAERAAIKKLFRCSVCRLQFKKYTDLFQHVLSHGEVRQRNSGADADETKETYYCRKCQKSYALPANFVQHALLPCQGKTWVCELCRAKLKTSFGLKVHLWSHFSGKPPPCNKCLAFLMRNDRIESEPGPFLCEACSSRLRKPVIIKQPKKIDMRKSVVCKRCNNSTRLRKHDYDSKSGELSFNCNYCLACLVVARIPIETASESALGET